MTEPMVQKITVLVVDDEPMVRLLCRRMLEPAGYDIFEAAGVAEALAMLEQGVQVDAVVSDVRMPHDGKKLATHLANRRPGTPILFISAFDRHLAELTALGPLLTKPFTGSQLVASVQGLLACDI